VSFEADRHSAIIGQRGEGAERFGDPIDGVSPVASFGKFASEDTHNPGLQIPGQLDALLCFGQAGFRHCRISESAADRDATKSNAVGACGIEHLLTVIGARVEFDAMGVDASGARLDTIVSKFLGQR